MRACFPGWPRAGDGQRERQADYEADALPVPPTRQAKVSTTPSIPKHLQRAQWTIWERSGNSTLFGYHHGIITARDTTFFENVSKHKVEGRELADAEKEENFVLEFKPRRDRYDVCRACLWSHWEGR